MSDNFPLHVNEVIEEYGKCLELVPIDPHFKNISVSLYEKNNVATVWTFSRKNGVSKRIEQIPKVKSCFIILLNLYVFNFSLSSDVLKKLFTDSGK